MISIFAFFLEQVAIPTAELNTNQPEAETTEKAEKINKVIPQVIPKPEEV